MTIEFTVCVTDNTPEMSTRPLNDASPDVNLGAVTMPVNMGEAILDFKFNEASTVEKFSLAFNKSSTCEKLGFKFNDAST